MHQAAWWQEEKERRRRKMGQDKPVVQAAIDKGIEWMRNPESQELVANIALAVANIVLPEEGTGAKARNVLEALRPFISGDCK